MGESPKWTVTSPPPGKLSAPCNPMIRLQSSHSPGWTSLSGGLEPVAEQWPWAGLWSGPWAKGDIHSSCQGKGPFSARVTVISAWHGCDVIEL